MQREHWPMFLIATIPIGGGVVAVGSAAFVIANKLNGEISEEIETDALLMALYGMLTTVFWIIMLVIA